jgi:surface polysaccharide O-acyltransferase-like enzyme
MANKSVGPKPSSGRSCSLDYLRSAITVLVVFLHAILAYPTWGRFYPANYLHSTGPVIDPQKTPAFDLVPALLNGFFMALMFFISGLFVWKSLATKGAACFLKDRWRRLGIPYVLSLAVIMPLAYYPSFLLTGAQEDIFSYWCGWSWISGPAWFLSMLLGFNLLAVIAFRIAGPSHHAVADVLVTQPGAFFLALIILSGVGFMPLMAMYGPYRWLEWGPFTIGQANRLVLYAVYFFAGVAAGARGLETTFLKHPGPLSRRWWAWLMAAAIAALALVVALGTVKVDSTGPWTRPAGWWQLGCCMVLYSATLSLAFLALFLRFVHTRHPWIDSLSDNAYAIYLVHYPFVIWSQYVLLGSSLPAATKALVVFGVSLGLSWGASVLLRSIPGVRAFL